MPRTSLSDYMQPGSPGLDAFMYSGRGNYGSRSILFRMVEAELWDHSPALLEEGGALHALYQRATAEGTEPADRQRRCYWREQFLAVAAPGLWFSLRPVLSAQRCRWCAPAFQPTRRGHIYCSETCRVTWCATTGKNRAHVMPRREWERRRALTHLTMARKRGIAPDPGAVEFLKR